MDIRERIEAFWSGEKPDRIPYTIYQNEWRHDAGDAAWEPLYRAGLGVTWGLRSYRTRLRGVESIDEMFSDQGRSMRRHRYRTASGEISATWLTGERMDDWPHKYYLETPQDYRVMADIVRRTEILPDYQGYIDRAASLPDHAIPWVDAGNSPLLKIMLDLAGLENFGVHWFEYPAEMMELYEALRVQFGRICEIVAGGPGRFVSVPESFSVDITGPKRFRDYVLNCYQENFPEIRSAGKIVGPHFDGKTLACKEMVHTAPFDLLESLTPPPEGDQTLAEARAAWPEKLFWCNINVTSYTLPPDQLKAVVRELVRQGAPDSRRLAFEISESIPANWRESIPVVLDTLREIAET